MKPIFFDCKNNEQNTAIASKATARLVAGLFAIPRTPPFAGVVLSPMRPAYESNQSFARTSKVRYKGLMKNAAQVFSLVGLTNLYLKRRALMT